MFCHPEELKEFPSIQPEEAIVGVVTEDGTQAPELQWKVTGNVPHRHIFGFDIIVTKILGKSKMFS